ncbi:MAG: hypothetical protein V4544_02635 [Pseudomonadota bacterium]
MNKLHVVITLAALCLCSTVTYSSSMAMETGDNTDTSFFSTSSSLGLFCIDGVTDLVNSGTDNAIMVSGSQSLEQPFSSNSSAQIEPPLEAKNEINLLSSLVNEKALFLETLNYFFPNKKDVTPLRGSTIELIQVTGKSKIKLEKNIEKIGKRTNDFQTLCNNLSILNLQGCEITNANIETYFEQIETEIINKLIKYTINNFSMSSLLDSMTTIKQPHITNVTQCEI